MILVQKSSRYRWYILLLAMLTYGSIAGTARLSMPVLFPEISAELGLSMVAIGTIWGMDPLAGVFMGLPGGMLVDRVGIKRTLTVVCILAGIFCALRGFSINFVSMAAFMFLFGLMAAVIPSIVPKVTAVWFSGKHLALANGLLNVAWAIGSVIATLSAATLFSPLLGGWRNVLFLFGVPPVLLGLLWWFTTHDAKPQLSSSASSAGVPFRQALRNVVHIKEVWILGLILLTYFGANMGLGGYLPLYLRHTGWTPASADWAMTIFSGLGVIGTIPMVLISDKIGSRKKMMMFTTIVFMVCVALIPVVGVVGTWICLIICGLIRTAVSALANTLIFEIKGIGATYGGTAMGLTNTLGMLGAFAASPIGNSFSSINDHMPLVFWAVLTAAGIPLLLCLKESKTKLGTISS
jgi:sugar phosphate permease